MERSMDQLGGSVASILGVVNFALGTRCSDITNVLIWFSVMLQLCNRPFRYSERGLTTMYRSFFIFAF